MGEQRATETPRFEQHPPLLIAGPRTSAGEPAAIPALWQRFAAEAGQASGAMHNVDYGLCLRAAGGEADCFDYVAGCAVTDFERLPADWARVRIPAHRYAVFPHRGHVSQLRDTIDAIFSRWLPAAGCEPAPAGTDDVGFFERYGEGFDPRAGCGDIEIWVPVKASRDQD